MYEDPLLQAPPLSFIDSWTGCISFRPRKSFLVVVVVASQDLAVIRIVEVVKGMASE